MFLDQTMSYEEIGKSIAISDETLRYTVVHDLALYPITISTSDSNITKKTIRDWLRLLVVKFVNISCDMINQYTLFGLSLAIDMLSIFT